MRRVLLPGQVPLDRPDRAARASLVKLQSMMYVIDEKLFGNVAAYLYEVKFQKRVLPHGHCIIFLDQVSEKL